MSDFIADQEDRNEDDACGEGRTEDRTRNFLRACERGAARVLAHFHVANDVLEDDDRVVDQRADRKREAGEADDVDRAAHREHDHDGRDDGERHTCRDDHDAAPRAQKDHEGEHREKAALPDVVENEIERFVDVDRLVVDELNGERL